MVAPLCVVLIIDTTRRDCGCQVRVYLVKQAGGDTVRLILLAAG